MVPISNLELTLYIHQLLRYSWTVFQESGECEGGWYADDMRLAEARADSFVAFSANNQSAVSIFAKHILMVCSELSKPLKRVNRRDHA